jgi:histone-binding protein RBBP4
MINNNINDSEIESEKKYSIKSQIIKTLEWPSYTISILQDNEEENKNINFLLGTNTNNTESNYLISAFYDIETEKINIKRKLKHSGNVIKVFYLNSKKALTSSSDNNIYLYDLHQKHSEVSTKPNLILKAHNDYCTSLSLNKGKNTLISTSLDGKLCLWNITSTGSLGILKPLNEISYHESCINDSDWNKNNEYLFCSCGDDKKMIFYDIRDSNKVISVKTQNQLKKIKYNKMNSNLLLTANDENKIDLWDLRNTKVKLHAFEYHKGEITSIKWSDINEKIFVSSSIDSNLVTWNLKYLEEFNSVVNGEDFPSEVEWIKNLGHRILDFDYSKNIIGVVDIENHIKILMV